MVDRAALVLLVLVVLLSFDIVLLVRCYGWLVVLVVFMRCELWCMLMLLLAIVLFVLLLRH